MSPTTFAITDVPGAVVQPDFTVAGTVDGSLGVVVTVTLSVPGHPPATAQAVVNADEDTWEAIFRATPPGAGAAVEASYPGAPTPLPRSDNITVVGPVFVIDRPADGDGFPSWDAVQAGGTYDDRYTLLFYLTQAGANLTGPPESLTAGEADPARKTWQKLLKKLVKKVIPKPGSGFCLHVLAVQGGRTVRGASGFFTVK